jgi:hypothetical protein
MWNLVTNRLETIGDDAFAHCVSLEHVTLLSARIVRKWAFNSCTRLTTFDLPPEGLAGVGESPFKNCPSRIASKKQDDIISVMIHLTVQV